MGYRIWEFGKRKAEFGPPTLLTRFAEELRRVSKRKAESGKSGGQRSKKLGSEVENHTSGTLIRKIEPLAVELHRPSTIRGSGHTFEYLGFGPGNYSTGLPQVQLRTLSEREEFLVQVS